MPVLVIRPAQVVYVSSAEDHEGRLWVSIDAVVGRADQTDLLHAIRLAGDGLCGGIATMPIGEGRSRTCASG